jgi:hypothetical protein
VARYVVPMSMVSVIMGAWVAAQFAYRDIASSAIVLFPATIALSVAASWITCIDVRSAVRKRKLPKSCPASAAGQLLVDAAISLETSMGSRRADIEHIGEVAIESPDLVVPVLVTLLGFIHRETGYRGRGGARTSHRIGDDVQEALRVIGSLRSGGCLPQSLRLDLSWCDLTGAQLHGMDFSGVDLHHAILDGADLSNTNLDSANLTYCSLQKAQLAGTSLDQAVLFKADLAGASLLNCRLSRAILAGALAANVQMHGSLPRSAAQTNAGHRQDLIPSGF